MGSDDGSTSRVIGVEIFALNDSTEVGLANLLLTTGETIVSAIVFVKIFAKVPYLQHYYDTGCMEEGSSVLERVAEVRS